MTLFEEVVRDHRAVAKHGFQESTRYARRLRESIRRGEVRFDRTELADVPLRGMFRALAVDRHNAPVGNEFLSQCDDARSFAENLREAADAIYTTHFSNLLGAMSFSEMLEVFERPEYIAMRLVTVKQSKTQFQEVIPGMGVIGDVAEDVGEGEEYPRVGLTEEWITVPAKIKDGFIIAVTEEAAFEETAGMLMDRVNTGTDAMAITREKEGLDTITGITTSYSRNGGPKQATYANSHTQGDFDNLEASNALADYTDLNNVKTRFAAMRDPNTGEPVIIGGRRQLLAPDELALTAANILNTTSVTLGADSAAIRTTMGNPLAAAGLAFELITSPYVSLRTSSTSTWFYGDFPGAFEYREIWPIQTFALDRNSHLGFNRDIITQMKFRRKGAFAVRRPWRVVKSTA